MDSDCCSSKECSNNPHCLSSPDPLDILLRKQPPPPTASFFQRMQFLIEEDSVQSYANRPSFNERSVYLTELYNIFTLPGHFFILSLCVFPYLVHCVWPCELHSIAIHYFRLLSPSTLPTCVSNTLTCPPGTTNCVVSY